MSDDLDSVGARWSEQRLQMLISGKIEENSMLEYKRAAALDRSDQKKKAEISKDVSAFANSAGGTLIYGIAEGVGLEEHIPVAFDPVDRSQYSKEWLEQIISNIQPKIDGVEITPVTIGSCSNDVCYVVEIPESTTAHQAVDNRYYKRGNFISEAMKDYEIRLVMNRVKHPVLDMQIRLLRGYEIILQIKISNVGPRIAKQYLVEVSVPAVIGGVTHRLIDDRAELDIEGNWRVILPVGVNPKPLFPGLTRTMQIRLDPAHVSSGHIPTSTSEIMCRLFADEMPFIEKAGDPKVLGSEWI